MIKYSLKCNEDDCKTREPFNGWFQNSASFKKQINAGYVSCPYCGSLNIGKNLMSPTVKSTQEKQSKMNKTIDMGILLRNLKTNIKKNAEFVGKNFAKEAIAINEGKSKERSIYGQANSKDLEDLRSRNIDVINVPWIQDDN
tara:strand:- start:568 stop:993 length:426 start_codon:yes stop_codon:yes gene_type:complete